MDRLMYELLLILIILAAMALMALTPVNE